jgi:hypothetical protein
MGGGRVAEATFSFTSHNHTSPRPQPFRQSSLLPEAPEVLFVLFLLFLRSCDLAVVLFVQAVQTI